MLKPLSTLSSAPHRLGFCLGALLLLCSLLLWSIELVARQTALPLLSALPAMFWHGYLMVYGFFPLFMLGFIYTAGPRWLNVASPAVQHYAAVMVGFAAGSLACVMGRWYPALMLLGITLHLMAWSAATAIWWRALLCSDVVDKTHAQCIAIAFGLGVIGMLSALYWLIYSDSSAWQCSIAIGVWGLLLPVFLSVSHRMIPFFSNSVLPNYSVWRPLYLLYTLVGCSFVMIFFKALQINTFVPNLLMAVLLIYTSYRWQLMAAWPVKLLAMLHLAFAWAAITFVLGSVSDGLALLGLSGLGYAPLHALTLGFFCTMLLAFVTRVTLGHSGRPLLAGGIAWSSYCLMHGVALARVLGELIPAGQAVFYLGAAVLAVLAIALWMKVYLPMYWQARIDGKPG